MDSKADYRHWLKGASMALLATLVLSACGGGSDDDAGPTTGNPPPVVGNDPTPRMASGFTPSTDLTVAKGQTYPDFSFADSLNTGPIGGRSTDHPLGCNFSDVPTLPLPDGGAFANGTTGNGGIAIGGAPGRFVNVEITVTDLQAKQMGIAIVDDTGLATLYPESGYTGGLIVTIRGTANGLYYDPGSQRFEPFRASESMRAVVDSIRGDIAVTPLTEAAAVLMGQDRSIANVRAQNERVARLVNQCLPAAFQVRDITRLPGHLLTPTSGETSVTDEFAGRQSIAISGLIRAFASDVTGFTGRPMFVFSEYLVQEIQDNLMDGQINGQPISTQFSPTGNFISDEKFFSNVKWGVDQVWVKYRDSSYAPLLDAQTAEYDCYEFVNGTSVGGVDGNGNPISTRRGQVTYYPVTNSIQFNRQFQFSSPYKAVKEGPDQFNRTQQKEFETQTQRTDSDGVTTEWAAKRTIVYVPSFFKRKIIQPDQSSTEVQCYGNDVPVAQVQIAAPVAPREVTTDPDLADGFDDDTF